MMDEEGGLEVMGKAGIETEGKRVEEENKKPLRIENHRARRLTPSSGQETLERVITWYKRRRRLARPDQSRVFYWLN